jgi:hypothetical protein
VDITFWVIQALLLTPVLVLAVSVGMEDRPTRGRRGAPPPSSDAVTGPSDSDNLRQPVAATPHVVAAAYLSQFTVEQQARLVILRSFVQEARSGGGALRDDMVAVSVVPDRHDRKSRWWPRLTSQQLMLVGGALLVGFGLVGVARTSMAMDDLQRTSFLQTGPLTPAARLLPGAIVNPAKYLSAVNASAGPSRGDQLYAVGQMGLKEAMDRWEALLGLGVGLLLFANAMRGADEESTVAVDLAPFILVASALFAGLSFFELP